jgi:hypothetical protein
MTVAKTVTVDWECVGVVADDPEGSFIYTVGLHENRGHAELWMPLTGSCGHSMSHRGAEYALNSAAARMVLGRLTPGGPWPVDFGRTGVVVFHLGEPSDDLREAAETFAANPDALVAPVSWHCDHDAAYPDREAVRTENSSVELELAPAEERDFLRRRAEAIAGMPCGDGLVHMGAPAPCRSCGVEMWVGDDDGPICRPCKTGERSSSCAHCAPGKTEGGEAVHDVDAHVGAAVERLDEVLDDIADRNALRAACLDAADFLWSIGGDDPPAPGIVAATFLAAFATKDATDDQVWPAAAGVDALLRCYLDIGERDRHDDEDGEVCARCGHRRSDAVVIGQTEAGEPLYACPPGLC